MLPNVCDVLEVLFFFRQIFQYSISNKTIGTAPYIRRTANGVNKFVIIYNIYRKNYKMIGSCKCQMCKQ